MFAFIVHVVGGSASCSVVAWASTAVPVLTSALRLSLFLLPLLGIIAAHS